MEWWGHGKYIEIGLCKGVLMIKRMSLIAQWKSTKWWRRVPDGVRLNNVLANFKLKKKGKNLSNDEWPDKPRHRYWLKLTENSSMMEYFWISLRCFSPNYSWYKIIFLLSFSEVIVLKIFHAKRLTNLNVFY